MKESLDFTNAVKDCTGGNAKIKQSNYLPEGCLPVVDQGQELVAGYVDDESMKYKGTLPCVIFGDHTCILKYVDFDFVLGADGTKILVPDSDEINAKYLYYFLNTVHIPDRGYSRHFKYLKRCKIPVVSLSEQKQIVQILDTADTLRQKRKEQLNLLDDYLKSVFFEMFGYPVLNDKEWKTTYLDSVIDSIDSGWSPVCLDTQRQTDETPVILKLSAVTYCYFNPKNHKVIPANIKIEKRVEVKKQDLLFTRKNTKELVAASVFVFECERNLLLPDTIFRLNYKKELVNGIYLWKLFVEEGFRKVIQNLATGSAGSMPNISKEKLRKLKILLPPLQLQNKFASIVEQVEQTKQKMRASLDEMDNHFNALMQRYFG